LLHLRARVQYLILLIVLTAMPIVPCEMIKQAAEHFIQMNNIPKQTLGAFGVPAMTTAKHPYFKLVEGPGDASRN
jgi:hypothetical protein